MTAEKTKEVEKMIAKVEKKKDLTRAQAIDYMLGVATGRLLALWRYDESLPEGKTSKGILAVSGRKKRAEKSARIVVLPDSEAPKESKPKKRAPKAAKDKPKKARTPSGIAQRGKPKKAKAEKDEGQIEIVAAAE